MNLTSQKVGGYTLLNGSKNLSPITSPSVTGSASMHWITLPLYKSN